MDELHYVFQQINCSLSLNQPNILSALCAKPNAEVAQIIKPISMKSNVCNSLNYSAQYIGRHD
jgi:hypothetical protein